MHHISSNGRKYRNSVFFAPHLLYALRQKIVDKRKFSNALIPLNSCAGPNGAKYALGFWRRCILYSNHQHKQASYHHQIANQLIQLQQAHPPRRTRRKFLHPCHLCQAILETRRSGFDFHAFYLCLTIQKNPSLCKIICTGGIKKERFWIRGSPCGACIPAYE